MRSPNVDRWFKDRRGISADTLDAFGVVLEREDDGLPILKLPYPTASKYRKGLEKDGRKFWWDPPSEHGQSLFTPPDAGTGKKMILVEGETDTMALWQNAPVAARHTVRGLPGTESWKPHFEKEFEAADTVYVILDNDDPYDNKDAFESGERGWKKIRDGLGSRKARRVRLPQGINDLCEFFQKYGWPALKVLLDQASEVKLPYARLDLSGPPPDYDWMVKDLVAQGDVVMVAGDPGVGKSWICLDLAMAVMGLRKDWLGMSVLKEGPVVVVDQENPRVTALQRMAKLGLYENHPLHKQMHYLWYQGVRLDDEPEKLFEYCDIVRPSLVVVDSISRVHFKNENSAEDMNPLLNGGIYPLARELGCTVVMIHHLAKHGGARGSTALPAATDLSLSVKQQTLKDGSETGAQYIIPDKLRNVPEWGETLLTRRVQDGDRVKIVQEDPAAEDAY